MPYIVLKNDTPRLAAVFTRNRRPVALRPGGKGDVKRILTRNPGRSLRGNPRDTKDGHIGAFVKKERAARIRTRPNRQGI